MHKKMFDDNNCGCMPDRGPERGPEMRLARAYIPNQQLGEVYCPKEALAKGTLFPELWMPYPYI